MNRKIQSVQKLTYWAVFISGILFSNWLACGKQKVITPPPATHKIPLIRVALDPQISSGTLLFREPFRLVSEEATYILDEEMGQFFVQFQNGFLTIKNTERSFSFNNFHSIELIPENEGIFLWNNISYSGRIIFRKSKQSVQLINVLPFPQYLEGVVPYEIPTHSDEYYQAILAQTIAARTYALYRIKNPESTNFDLYADTRDQVYQGTRNKSELVQRAVLESYGAILETQQNDLIKIQYHSTCGGTIDPSVSQPETEMPVLQDHSSSNDFCIVSPLYRWVTQLTTRDILTNLVNLGFLPQTEIQVWTEEGFEMNLEVLSRKPSGRIEKLAVSVGDKSILLQEWQIRRLFSAKPGQLQPSTLFFLKSSPSNPGLVYVIGAGFGHGRGMCQWGAIGKALEGESYKDILKFYYPELILNKIY
ncbi:MAG: SpoIID/LytB domain-containing protein [bacterium]|nr:MAG: SpoIID/LytB domain-containing protein [bacterium]